MSFIEFLSNLFKKKVPSTNPSLEDYYNNKYPKSNISYMRTDKMGDHEIDVRLFVNYHDYRLPAILGNGDDEKALNALLWVQKNLKYVPDSNQYKKSEYWAFGYETLDSKEGDCEDGAILLYDILRANGIPDWKIRLTAGNVNDGSGGKAGHCYLNYFCEETKKWVVLDWCYYPNQLPVNQRVEYKADKNYEEVWFSFNEEYSWTQGLNTDANKLLKK